MFFRLSRSSSNLQIIKSHDFHIRIEVVNHQESLTYWLIAWYSHSCFGSFPALGARVRMRGRLTLAKASILPWEKHCEHSRLWVSPQTLHLYRWLPVLQWTSLAFFSFSLFLSGFREEETPDMSQVYLSGMIR